MNLTGIEENGVLCVLVESDEPVITDAQSAIDLLMSAQYDVGSKDIAIPKQLIAEDFLANRPQHGAGRRDIAEVRQLRWPHGHLRRLLTLHEQTAQGLHVREQQGQGLLLRLHER